MTGAYVGFAFLTTVIPLPVLGITAEVIAAQGFTESGIWIEQPYRVIAFGFLYFSALGLYELWSQVRTPVSPRGGSGEQGATK